MNYLNLKSIADAFCWNACKWQGAYQCNKEKCPLHDFINTYGRLITRKPENNN